jgi:hypothetical protein
MRILKPLLLALLVIAAAVAGLFVVVIVAIVGALIFAVLRLFGKRPTFSASWRGRSPTPPRPTAGAIDVVATEVPADRLTH